MPLHLYLDSTYTCASILWLAVAQQLTEALAHVANVEPSKWAPMLVCLLTSCRCIWCICFSRTPSLWVTFLTLGIWLAANMKYHVLTDLCLLDSSLPWADTCLKVKKHPLGKTGISADFTLNEKIQLGLKVNLQSEKKFYYISIRNTNKMNV